MSQIPVKPQEGDLDAPLRVMLVVEQDATQIVDLVEAACSLSRSQIKDAMLKGALWLKPAKGGSRRRLRKHKGRLRQGDRLELCYDAKLLALDPPLATLIEDFGQYSLWFKPAGLLSQGTDFGDHCAIERQVSLRAQRREIYIVHRLDREVSGMMLLAHSKKGAAALGKLFQQRNIEKGYRALVKGDLAKELGAQGLIDSHIDGKQARTRFQVLNFDPESGQSLIALRIESGRLHQIRRHLAHIGYPVMGDPRYGRGNKNRDGMKLVADFLAFACPFNGAPRNYQLTQDLLPF